MDDKIACERLANWRFGENEALVYQRGLLSVLRRCKPDAVIAEFNARVVSNVLLWFYARVSGLPFIWWGHGVGPTSGRIIAKFRFILARRSNAVIFYGRRQADYFVANGLGSEKAFVAQNAIDTEAIHKRAVSWEGTVRQRIVYVGRLIEEKKVDLLIRAFGIAVSTLPEEVCLTILGEGPELSSLQLLVQQLGIDRRVQFVGAFYDEDAIAAYFNDALISVSPGYIGLSAIHSLAYGVPVLLARDEPHSPEVEALHEGLNCMMVPSNDVGALADALATLVADLSMLQRLSAGAIRTIETKFTINGMVKAFENAIAHAVGG